jgi:hypothetical protein
MGRGTLEPRPITPVAKPKARKVKVVADSKPVPVAAAPKKRASKSKQTEGAPKSAKPTAVKSAPKEKPARRSRKSAPSLFDLPAAAE